jgi:parallel beta-helix repeat protein
MVGITINRKKQRILSYAIILSLLAMMLSNTQIAFLSAGDHENREPLSPPPIKGKENNIPGVSPLIPPMNQIRMVSNDEISLTNQESRPTSGANWSFRDAHNVQKASDMGYSGGGVKVALVDSGIDFGTFNLAGKYMVENRTGSPYYGWPMAFDPLAMSSYLQTGTVIEGNGGYTDTTRNGTGPFDLNHVIQVDGINNFSSRERIGTDRYGDVRTNGTATGCEFDLTELYATRDTEFWYTGMKTRYAQMNRTFGFAFDFDGPASGSITDPRGNLLDYEASHSAPIEQVAYEPIHGWLASCAARGSDNFEGAVTTGYEINTVKVWNTGGQLLRNLSKENYPVYSVAWSPNGNMLAYQTSIETVVYRTDTWSELWRISHSTYPVPQYRREALAFSPNGTILITGSIDTPRILVLNVLTGATSYPLCQDLTRSVVYSPNGRLIALGQSNGRVTIVNSTTFATSLVLQTFIDVGIVIEDSKPIETVAWSPDGERLATGRNSGGYINIWNLATAENVVNLTGHGTYSTVNSIKWLTTDIISGSDDGKVIFWNPSTYTLKSSKNVRDNIPVLSIDVKQSTGEIFVGMKDCTIRMYPPSSSVWDNASYVPFVAHKPDIVIYVRYEREYYDFSSGSQKLVTLDKVDVPEVYKWNSSSSLWMSTNMTNIFGKYFYKGALAGEWTYNGFLELALPRNFTACPDQDEVFIASFICGDNSSRPQDTVPSDCNVPSSAIPKYVDWNGVKIITLSAWSLADIHETTINHSAVQSVSGQYHFGYHPSEALTNMLGPVSLIITDSTTAGVWDRVYADMNTDFIIDSNDPWINIDNPVLAWDTWKVVANGTVEKGQDGIPDVSGGMLYFIADGVNKLPYSERMAVLSGITSPVQIPHNGELLAFFGEFGYDEMEGAMITHGTKMASVIAGSGLNHGEYGPILGVSPNVTFLPICNAQYDLHSSLYFATEGYDGIANTGDEADIVTIGQYISGNASALESTNQLISHLSNCTGNRTIFIAPSGNDGVQNGTISGPCGPNILVVGFAEDNTFIEDGGGSLHYGDVSQLSSKGPTPIGLVKPDVIAIGIGAVDLPLGSFGSLVMSVGGKNSYAVWRSCEFAAAVASGISALTMEAYREAKGNYPDARTAMEIVTSTTRDLGLDPYMQGHGFLDAYASVMMARGDDGLKITTAPDHPDEALGAPFNDFVSIVAPGESVGVSADIMNMGIASENAAYALEHLEKTNTASYNFILIGPSSSHIRQLSSYIPWDVQVVRVTAQTSLAGFASGYGSYKLTLFDWVDAQPIGNPWHGVIDNADDLSYLTSTGYEENNTLACTLANPHANLEGVLAVKLSPNTYSMLFNRNWTMVVESFVPEEWSWSAITKTTGIIGPSMVDSLDINISVPSNAIEGFYCAQTIASYDVKDVSMATSINASSLPETQYLNTMLNSTIWDDGTTGNYWDDYTGPGAYPINGGSNADRFPLTAPMQVIRAPSPPIVITSNSDFVIFSNRGDGTAGNPWIIEDLDIDGSFYTIPGIDISNTDDYFIIRNCVIHDAQVDSNGISLNNVTNGAIIDSDVHANTGCGIYICGGSESVLLQNNIVNDNSLYGIFIESSSKITATDNAITANYFCGIYITGVIITCADIIIAGNVIHNQVPDYGFSIGICVEYATSCVVKGNTIYNELLGIYMALCDNSEISNNTLDGFDGTSGMYSIMLESSSPNIITNNDFVNTTAVHAYDDAITANVWDGNYWEDNAPYASPYTGIDDGGSGSGVQDYIPEVHTRHRGYPFILPATGISHWPMALPTQVPLELPSTHS